MFPFDWLDEQKKLSHAGPVCCEYFYSNLKDTIAKCGYKQLLNIFKEIDWTGMGICLWVFNVVDVPFIEEDRWETLSWHDLCMQIRSYYPVRNEPAFEERQKRLGYMNQETFVTYVKINEKKIRTVVGMVPWNVVLLWRMSIICSAFAKGTHS